MPGTAQSKDCRQEETGMHALELSHSGGRGVSRSVVEHRDEHWIQREHTEGVGAESRSDSPAWEELSC